MKKCLALLCAVSTVLALCACSRREEIPDTFSTETIPETGSQTEYSLPESALPVVTTIISEASTIEPTSSTKPSAPIITPDSTTEVQTTIAPTIPEYKVPQSLRFESKFLTTHSSSREHTRDELRWITSPGALKQYLQELNMIDPDSESDKLAEYDDTFFEAHDLIAVYIFSGSGSYKYEVKKVILDAGTKEDVPYTIQTEILRTTPSDGAVTCDVVYWTALIAVEKGYASSADLAEPIYTYKSRPM